MEPTWAPQLARVSARASARASAILLAILLVMLRGRLSATVSALVSGIELVFESGWKLALVLDAAVAKPSALGLACYSGTTSGKC